MRTQQTNQADAYQTLLVIWFSLLISQFLFLALVYFIKPGLLQFNFTKPIVDDDAIVVAAIGFVA
ncbi:MAG TPA: hypothetical protein VJL58_05390 [Pyrinomonadaceae bacterium]|nr:hypothetical protein [Pyrinomonadaceae bacterium]